MRKIEEDMNEILVPDHVLLGLTEGKIKGPFKPLPHI